MYNRRCSGRPASLLCSVLSAHLLLNCERSMRLQLRISCSVPSILFNSIANLSFHRSNTYSIHTFHISSRRPITSAISGCVHALVLPITTIISMCEYNQLEYRCGHCRYTVRSWCTRQRLINDVFETKLSAAGQVRNIEKPTSDANLTSLLLAIWMTSAVSSLNTSSQRRALSTYLLTQRST